MVSIKNNIQPTSHISSSLSQIFASLPKEGKKLDLGCGGGGQLSHLINGIGLDYSMDNLRYCKILGKPLCCSDLQKPLPFAPESNVVVLISHVLEHVSSPLELCLEAHRILCKNGFLIIGVPLEQSMFRKVLRDDYFKDHPGHIYGFTPAGLRQLVQFAKFKVKDTLFDIPLARRLKLTKIQKMVNRIMPEWVLYSTCANFWVVAQK